MAYKSLRDEDREMDDAAGDKRGLVRLQKPEVGKVYIWFSLLRSGEKQSFIKVKQLIGTTHVLVNHTNGNGDVLRDGGAIRCDELWEKKSK